MRSPGREKGNWQRNGRREKQNDKKKKEHKKRRGGQRRWGGVFGVGIQPLRKEREREEYSQGDATEMEERIIHSSPLVIGNQFLRSPVANWHHTSSLFTPSLFFLLSLFLPFLPSLPCPPLPCPMGYGSPCPQPAWSLFLMGGQRARP